MPNKTETKVARRTQKQRELLSSALSIGHEAATRYGAFVTLLSGIASNAALVAEASREYEVGYVVGYFETAGNKDRATYVRQRWGNMDLPQRYEAARGLFGLSGAKTEKTNRRTDLEEKAVSAAKASSATARRQAGIEAKKGAGRKPRPASNENDKTNAPVSLDALKPFKFTDRKHAVSGFLSMGSFLSAMVNANALVIPPQFKSRVEDFVAGIKADVKTLRSIGAAGTAKRNTKAK